MHIDSYDQATHKKNSHYRIVLLKIYKFGGFRGRLGGMVFFGIETIQRWCCTSVHNGEATQKVS